MIKYKFSRENSEFFKTLRSRVYSYFKEEKLSRNANPLMVLKTISALSMYLVPFALILFSGIANLWILFALWIAMGLGKSFIGTSVMHDALHGSYSDKKWINSWIGFTAFIIGANPKMWKLQHNVLHHTYTNIEHADEDISPRFVLRFTPHQPRRWFHRYQHIYASFFYSLSILLWVTIKDFRKIFEYSDMGLIAKGKAFWSYLLEISIHRVLYFGAFLVLPMILLPVAAWQVVGMYLCMEAITGLVLTLIFQTAHVMPDSHFVDQEHEEIEENWAIHQLLTTTNFGTKNKVLSWFTGGLNFQIEHHLFPEICHIHYPEIARIVKQTAAEFNLPYHEIKTFRSALLSHFQMLKDLGRKDHLSPMQVPVSRGISSNKVHA